MYLVKEPPVFVIRLDKGPDHYVFMYTRDRRSEMVRQMGKWARDPELSFSTTDMRRIAAELRKDL